MCPGLQPYSTPRISPQDLDNAAFAASHPEDPEGAEAAGAEGAEGAEGAASGGVADRAAAAAQGGGVDVALLLGRASEAKRLATEGRKRRLDELYTEVVDEYTQLAKRAGGLS